MTDISIRVLEDSPSNVVDLAALLRAAVVAGGSVHFMDPVPAGAAEAYWRQALADACGRVVLGGFAGERLAGTVTVWLDTPPNQTFRAEIWKLMVNPGDRRQGVAVALMTEAETIARSRGRTLLNLDTAVDGGGAELYERLGWLKVGEIPGYAYKPQGGLTATAIYYKVLA